MALTDSLVAFWRLDEASGNRADSSGNGYTLTDVNTVASRAGLIGTAADFVAASSQALTTTNATVCGTIVGASSWTLTMWLNPDLDDVARQPAGTFDGGFTGLICTRNYTGGGDTYTSAQFWNDAGSPLIQNPSVACPVGAWTFFACWVDTAAGKFYARTNATATAGGSLSGTYSANAQFALGYRGNGGSRWDGGVDMVGLWSRALSSTELDTLHASGAGYDPTAAAAGLPVIAWEHARVFGP